MQERQRDVMRHYRWTIVTVTGETIDIETFSSGGIAPFNGSINVIDLEGRCWVFNWDRIAWYRTEAMIPTA
ncbi:MAG: hypothetical protein KGI71_05315 [Patescibacteria group bacterium]|nr:hypothetical protein [Patescibacteria group bacterium]